MVGKSQFYMPTPPTSTLDEQEVSLKTIVSYLATYIASFIAILASYYGYGCIQQIELKPQPINLQL